MLHDSTCKRAEAYTGKENKMEGYKTCISVYDETEDGNIDWNTWRVYFGKLKPDYFEFDTKVIFNDQRGPIKKINESGRDTSRVYKMARAAQIAINNTDISDKFEYEVIVNYYRLNEYSVYILPKWVEDEIYYLGGDFHFVIDVKKQQILNWKMLNNKIAVFYPDLLAQTKISKSTNSISPYPTSTELLMMYRRKTGPAHISIAKEWHYLITPEVKIGILGLEEELNEQEWFLEWTERKGF